MRVTHVITRLVVGGAQENTIASVLGLQKIAGLEVNLISGPTSGPEGSLESSLDGSPGTLAILPELVRPVHPWKDWIALRRLTGIFREHKPDIVHTHSGKAGILGRMAAAKAGVPILLHHIHGPSFGPFQGPLANWMFTAAERHAGRITTHFVCSAGAMARLYLAAGIGRPDMYTRLFSGFRVEPFLNARNDLALRKQLGFAANDFVIGSVGRIAPLKGHADLLKAFRALLADCPHARLLIVGDGTLRTAIQAQTRSLGLEGRVIFTGLVPPGQVPQLIGIMDCLAHLSSREALSRALPQALAAGKPVVAYDFDGADEVCLESETGFLVPRGDVAAVAKRLHQLATDPVLRERLGGRGRQLVKEEFDVDRMVDNLHNLYRQLARERRIAIS
jgi:glycosyltransferase involved in cell wall biosynthesis